MSHDIFISYSTKDDKIADGVCKALEDNNLKCWIAPRDISHGESFPKQIVSGIKSAKLVVLIFSENAQNSEYVKKEMYTAFANRKKILSFMIDKTEPKGRMKFFLKINQWLEAYSNPEGFFDVLVKDAKKLCENADSEMLDGEDSAYRDAAQNYIDDYDEQKDIKSYEDLDFEREWNYGNVSAPAEEPHEIPFYQKYKIPIVLLIVVLIAVGGFMIFNGSGDNVSENATNGIAIDYVLMDNDTNSGYDWKYFYTVTGSLPSDVSPSSDYVLETDFYDDSGKVISSNKTKLTNVDSNTLATAGLDDSDVDKVSVELKDSSGKELYSAESDNIVVNNV